jgi:hypothetical protein
MADIALGIRSGSGDLENFAAQVNASYMVQWGELGLYDEDVEGWGQAFQQVVTRTLAAGGRIHFNLTGIDIQDALKGDPNTWVDRYTAWELQQIVRNREWFGRTTFYAGGTTLTLKQVSDLGIVSL